MTLFATLLLAHLLGDFPLQTNSIYRMKVQGHKGLALHAAIHVMVTAVLIYHFWQFWPILLLLGFLHYLTDWAKLRYSGDHLTPGFLLDQMIHVLILAFIALIAPPEMTSQLPLWFLLPAIALAIIPAILTFGYVWASDLCKANIPISAYTEWACTRLLPISQTAGWIVLVTLATAGFFVAT